MNAFLRCKAHGVLAVAVVALVLAGCSGRSGASSSEEEEELSSGSCGVERWAVKTLADPAATGVNPAPALTTIHPKTMTAPPTTSGLRLKNLIIDATRG